MQKDAEKKTKIQEFMYNDTTNVEHEVIIAATGIVKTGLKKNFEAIPGNIERFTTKDSFTWNITHNM
jgi:hypothetical protein